MDINKFLGRNNWDRNRGIKEKDFLKALKRASAHDVEVSVNPPKKDIWPRNSLQDDTGDPYDSTYLKPKNTKYWDKAPETPEEKAIYFGLHMHMESNPFGLHSHMVGGKLSGSHTHSPQNRMGNHHHMDGNPKMVQIDGGHSHEGQNHPSGDHDHHWSNFG